MSWKTSVAAPFLPVLLFLTSCVIPIPIVIPVPENPARYSARLEPPAQYNHPYAGPVVERVVPASAVAAMRPNGTTNIGAMIRSVLMRPREIPALFQTALDALAARTTLVRGRHLLGPVLSRVDSPDADSVTTDEAYLGSRMPTATMKSA
jgi:hypothetical protein